MQDQPEQGYRFSNSVSQDVAAPPAHERWSVLGIRAQNLFRLGYHQAPHKKDDHHVHNGEKGQRNQHYWGRRAPSRSANDCGQQDIQQDADQQRKLENTQNLDGSVHKTDSAARVLDRHRNLCRRTANDNGRLAPHTDECFNASVMPQEAENVPPNSQILQILEERIDTYRRGIGIVLGIVDGTGPRILAHGTFTRDDLRPVNSETIFEIGSVTKIFTTLALAVMTERGEVALDDPVNKYLPAGIRLPQQLDREITLFDLATHTSGLPRLPPNLVPTNRANPYADYSDDRLYECLRNLQLNGDIGSRFVYSNFGGGLLGHILALRSGASYEALIQSRICQPLGMRSTGISVSEELKARFAPGHNTFLENVPNWDVSALAGAGALRSTADDLLKLLTAALGYVDSPLTPALDGMLLKRRPADAQDREVALGWIISSRNGRPIVWHNGGTGGYRSFLAYEPDRRVGVAVLSNTFTIEGVDDIGMHLLDPTFPLWRPSMHQKLGELMSRMVPTMGRN